MDAPKVRQCHNALNEFGGCVEYTRVLIVLWQGDRSLGGLAMQLHTGYNVTYDEVDLVERHKSAGGVGNILHGQVSRLVSIQSYRQDH